MYDWVNTGHQKSKMDQDEICPCCGIEEETLEHMYRCTSEAMTLERNAFFGVMRAFLKVTQCPSQVNGPFMETVQCICEWKEIHLQSNPVRVVVEAIEDQKRIGKQLMLRGLLSKKCREAIAKFTKERIGSKASQLFKVM